MLDEQGEAYRLEILLDGEAAIQFVKEHRSGAREHTPCVVLLDLHLPKYNGLEVLAAIREEPVLTHIHVLVLTSLASAREHDQVSALGAICRTKPADLAEISELGTFIFDLCRNHVAVR
jgi:two-component system response regulator